MREHSGAVTPDREVSPVNSVQFSLFDNQGNERHSSSEIAWLDITSLSPHPDNPRLIYRDDIIDAIAASISEQGFQPEYALLVRPYGDGYQIISGHTRHKAATKAGLAKLPCWVKPMDDEAAFMELVLANSQGELSPLEYGMHVLKYVELSEGGRGKKGGLSEYAENTGKDKGNLSRWKSGALVLQSINCCNVTTVLDKANHLSHIHKTPSQYWQQLTELLIENEWSVKQTEEICKAIKDIEIPNYLQFWLSPDAAIKQTINEALRGEVRTPRDIKNWVTEAEEQLENLPESRKVIIFDEQLGTEEIQYLNLKTDFLDRLPSLNTGDRKPSAQKIKALAKEVLDYAQGLDDAHARWLESKASEEEQAKQREAEHLRLLALQEKFAPIGINAPLQSLSIADIGESKYDAIITDVPYLLSNDGITVRSGKQASVNKNFDDSRESAIAPEDYMGIFFEALKMGGYFVTTCTIHTLPELITEAIAVGFEFREKLVWYKRNAPPLLTADRFKSDHEDILVFVKPGATPYFGYEDIKLKDDTQRGATIDIPQCGGNERLKWHDTQKPLELYELLVKAYCPKEGQVLEPFGGSGTTVVACKKLGRICTWIEQDESFFNKANDRIEDTSFHWEL